MHPMHRVAADAVDAATLAKELLMLGGQPASNLDALKAAAAADLVHSKQEQQHGVAQAQSSCTTPGGQWATEQLLG